MTPAELAKRIRSETVPPLLLMFGSEPYLLGRSLQQLLDATVPEEARDFNLQTFHARESSAEQILDNALTLPVFSERRAVVVRGIDKFKAEELEALLPYVKDPVPETCLIFIAEKIDRRKKFFQTFQKKGELVEFKALYDNQIPAFVKEQVVAAGFRLTEDASAEFSRRSGTNLQEIVGELEKLFQYVGDTQVIDVDDIRAIVSDTRVDTVFDMTNAIGQRKSGEAISLLRRLLDDNIAPVMILSMMTRHFRQLWMASELLGDGAGRADISKRLGINPYFVDGIMAQSRLFARPGYRVAFERFLATDLALKSGGGQPDALLEKLLLELTNQKK
jgi:DNA polymerase-3 subunit delta